MTTTYTCKKAASVDKYNKSEWTCNATYTSTTYRCKGSKSCYGGYVCSSGYKDDCLTGVYKNSSECKRLEGNDATWNVTTKSCCRKVWSDCASTTWSSCKTYKCSEGWEGSDGYCYVDQSYKCVSWTLVDSWNNYSYSWSSESKSESTSCTSKTFDCNSDNSGKTYVSCSVKSYKCADGTLNTSDNYCYKYNQSSCGSWTQADTDTSYSFSELTSDSAKCTATSSFTCNKSNSGKSYTTCSIKSYKCADGTLKSDNYCYKYNQSSCGSWTASDKNPSFGWGTVSATTSSSCTANTFDCNSSNSGKTYVSCSANTYSCSESGTTKLNNSYCYKIG